MTLPIIAIAFILLATALIIYLIKYGRQEREILQLKLQNAQLTISNKNIISDAITRPARFLKATYTAQRIYHIVTDQAPAIKFEVTPTLLKVQIYRELSERRLDFMAGHFTEITKEQFLSDIAGEKRQFNDVMKYLCAGDVQPVVVGSGSGSMEGIIGGKSFNGKQG